jgi:Condensation domain/AMP-binding enzyme
VTLADSALETEVFVFPASFAQQRLWFLAQLVPENPFYHVPAAIRLTGNLNIPVLEQTFNEILRRHEALRTTFAMSNGQLMQLIAPCVSLSIPVIDLQSVPASEQETIAHQHAIAQFQPPFDLTKDALIRVAILQLDNADYRLLLTLHHIVSDGWSIGVLIRELSAIYAAFLESKPSPLPELPIQYADFAHWQREFLRGEVLTSQLHYWKQQLADLPTLNLPSDGTYSALPNYRGATQQLTLSSNLTQSLEQLSQRTGTTLFMTLLAAFQVLLYRYTNQEDIVIGSPIANRNLTEIENLIGFFVNSLVLRTNLSGNPTFSALLERVQAVTLAAYAHQDLPFEKLVEELQPTRDLSRNPLFQVVFALQNAPIAPLELPNLTLTPIPFDPGTTRFDLEFHCFKDLETLHCKVVYSTELFDAATLDRMLQHFQILLSGIVANPNQTIAQLPLLTSAEQRFFRDWNNTQSNTSQVLFHRQFEYQTLQSPNAIAVVFTNQKLTYQELNQRADQLACYLQKLGVRSETSLGFVSIALPK